MAIKRRGEERPKGSVADVEMFIDSAEKRPTSELGADERVQRRAEGRYYQLINYRGTEEQKALIDYAAKAAGMSRQKLLEGILMPELEKRYGLDFEGTK